MSDYKISIEHSLTLLNTYFILLNGWSYEATFSSFCIRQLMHQQIVSSEIYYSMLNHTHIHAQTHKHIYPENSMSVCKSDKEFFWVLDFKRAFMANTYLWQKTELFVFTFFFFMFFHFVIVYLLSVA